MRVKINWRPSAFRLPDRHAAVAEPESDVASAGEVAAPGGWARRPEFMDQLARFEVPNLEAQRRIGPAYDLEVGRAQALHAGNIGLVARVELTERIAFEIPDANLAVGSAREQLPAIRRNVAVGLVVAQLCQRRQLLPCIPV